MIRREGCPLTAAKWAVAPFRCSSVDFSCLATAVQKNLRCIPAHLFATSDEEAVVSDCTEETKENCSHAHLVCTLPVAVHILHCNKRGAFPPLKLSLKWKHKPFFPFPLRAGSKREQVHWSGPFKYHLQTSYTDALPIWLLLPTVPASTTPSRPHPCQHEAARKAAQKRLMLQQPPGQLTASSAWFLQRRARRQSALTRVRNIYTFLLQIKLNTIPCYDVHCFFVNNLQEWTDKRPPVRQLAPNREATACISVPTLPIWRLMLQRQPPLLLQKLLERSRTAAAAATVAVPMQKPPASWLFMLDRRKARRVASPTTTQCQTAEGGFLLEINKAANNCSLGFAFPQQQPAKNCMRLGTCKLASTQQQ